MLGVVHVAIECLEGVGLGNVVLEDHSPKYFLPLVFGIGALVHQVKVISVYAEHSQQVGVDHLLQNILAVHAGNEIHLVHLQFLQNAHAFYRCMVEITRAVGKLDDIA